MSRKNKIALISSSRADFGLQVALLRAIQKSKKLTLRFYVTGTHLDARYGRSVEEIRKSGVVIHKTIPARCRRDDAQGLSEFTSKMSMALTREFQQNRPDALILCGDRMELMGFAFSAALHRIPIVHLYGGELTEGALDDRIRHAVTKLSSWHFTATPNYRRRVVQMGEDPKKVFCIGGPGLDDLKKTSWMTRPELSRSLKIPLQKPFFLVTYHPSEVSKSELIRECHALLKALERFSGHDVIFTRANADLFGSAANRVFERACARAPASKFIFSALGRLRYLSLQKLAAAVVGNSSSGLHEAPSMKVPTVNLGLRQTGRDRADSVIDVPVITAKRVEEALRRALSPAFRRRAFQTRNPYETAGQPSKRIVRFLEQTDFTSDHKKFFDFKGDRL